jgi:hypothetical protein
VVHFPIAIALLLPWAAAFTALAVAIGRLDARAWILVVLLHAAGVGAAWLAHETGHDQEERVEEALGETIEQPLHEHEDAAGWLLWLFAGTFVVSAAGLLRDGAGRAARLAAVLAAFAVSAASYQAGRTGGALVYEHGAANAYLRSP